MLRILSLVLTVTLFINIVVFVKWRELKRLPQLIGMNEAGGGATFSANPYDLKILEPIAITQSIEHLQTDWWNEAIRKHSLKNNVDRDFPEESPILIEAGTID